MSFQNNKLIQKQMVNEILQCNEVTENYGLALSESQAIDLLNTRIMALKGSGRVELSNGIVDKIIRKFCTSPYITSQNYTEIINSLVEMFYYYKNETLELIGDDDLINFMSEAFNNVCKGSLDLLSDRELYNLSRNLRFGFAADYVEPIDDDDDDEEEE